MTQENYRAYRRFLRHHFRTYCEQKQYVDPIRAGEETITTRELTPELYAMMAGAIQLYEDARKLVRDYEVKNHLQPTIFD